MNIWSVYYIYNVEKSVCSRQTFLILSVFGFFSFECEMEGNDIRTEAFSSSDQSDSLGCARARAHMHA